MARIARGLPTLLYLSLLPALAFAQTVVSPIDVNFKLNQQNTNFPVTQQQVMQQQPTVNLPAEKKNTAFLAFMNSEIHTVSLYDGEENKGKSEKEILREKWSNLLGIDIFLPYFKAKEIEDKISEKASIKIYKMKGKPVFENSQVKYVFKTKF